MRAALCRISLQKKISLCVVNGKGNMFDIEKCSVLKKGQDRESGRQINLMSE